MKISKISSLKPKDTSITEVIIILLVVAGLPSIAFLYVDLRAAYAAFILTLLSTLILKIRYGGN